MTLCFIDSVNAFRTCVWLSVWTSCAVTYTYACHHLFFIPRVSALTMGCCYTLPPHYPTTSPERSTFSIELEGNKGKEVDSNGKIFLINWLNGSLSASLAIYSLIVFFFSIRTCPSYIVFFHNLNEP